MEKKSLLEPLAVSPEPIIALEYQAMLHQVLFAAVKAELFGYLTEPHTPAELCAAKGWREPFALLLLRILLRAGFLAQQGSRYVNTALAEDYLRLDSELCLAECLQLDLAPGGFAQNVMALLDAKSEMPLRFMPHWGPSRLRRLSTYALTGNLCRTVEAISLRGDERVLDLGGGHGLYALALLEKYPRLQVTVQDLPEIVPLAAENAKRAGLSERLRLRAADFIAEELEPGYDVILCFNILSGEQRRRIILSKVREALQPGGRVLVKARFDDCEDTLRDLLDKLRWFAFGRKPLDTSADWLRLLGEMGFQTPRICVRLGGSGLLEARR